MYKLLFCHIFTSMSIFVQYSFFPYTFPFSSPMSKTFFFAILFYQWGGKFMGKLLDTLIINAFIAFGVILGGTLVGSLGAVFMGQAPGHSMLELASKLKIWALVTAMGGTFDTIRAIEEGFLGWQVGTLAKQLLLIFSAFLGAHAGYLLVLHLTGGRAR
jgi:hypothetical protein